MLCGCRLTAFSRSNNGTNRDKYANLCRGYMKVYKSSFSYLYLYFFLILLVVFSFYFFNPFSNKCIRGNCENGNGVYAFHSGMQYDGEWKNGKRDGQGTLTYSDGSKYTGGWKNNRMHGHGIKTYAPEYLYREYTGEWNNGNRHGKGTAIYSDGSRYEGYWKDGRAHGHGTITTIDARKITGDHIDGELQGTVTEIYPDGKILVVGWIDSKRVGRGTLTYPDGTKITGEWINNKLVGSPEFYLFYAFEFEKNYHVKSLCDVIKADISPSLKAPDNTLEWLNELLKEPNLYEELFKKKQKAEFSQEIDTLIELTKHFRNKRFSELDNDSRKDIIKLNRLLLEYIYPHLIPRAE